MQNLNDLTDGQLDHLGLERTLPMISETEPNPTFRVDQRAARLAGYATVKDINRAAKRALRYMRNQGGKPPGHIREKYGLLQVSRADIPVQQPEEQS